MLPGFTMIITSLLLTFFREVEHLLPECLTITNTPQRTLVLIQRFTLLQKVMTIHLLLSIGTLGSLFTLHPQLLKTNLLQKLHKELNSNLDYLISC
ncbi:hypothetical protein [Acidianus bottle-shaped virus]|uniref:Uncharacterized protein ORF95 n=1 Tax=Acidianus bottle-shaped virus (isolate Italy/Pozzuoli) TaxID=654911 RepID=Y095_ABVP|nr:hypothetical protein ABV_gp25 [Acidianus bottle-shaped virus]A4ZUB1.1 RecName: Full=Uncharacterized protein ORF95; Flags: Precursor [Acidianus bottle-shaped virus (isolate Pozzuoli)]ABP73415.1 hypothetical protein [Acidianus bottle-shaped virus]